MNAVAVRLPASQRGLLAADDAMSGRLFQAHHPDWLRTPDPRPGRIRADRTRAALVWNIFRTLALIDPSFWLRQLHARLFGFDERYRAPESLVVRLWVPATTPGAADSQRDTVDVVLESEQAVWGLLTVFERDVIVNSRDVEGPDPVLRTVDAVARMAGSRRCFVGMISSGESTAPIGARLIRRYAAELRVGRPRQQTGGRNVLGIGMGSWGTLATVIADAARAPAIDQPERLALYRCLRWLSATGVGSRELSRPA